MCVGCSYTCSSKSPKSRNLVTVDPEIEGGHKFREIMPPPKYSLSICTVGMDSFKIFVALHTPP
jgi:hypothetical protein